MRSVDIVFMYEHAARELDVSCAITSGLRQSGFSVAILQWPTGFPKAVTQLQPKVVVLPFCYTEQSYDALLAYWRNSTFFNMSWEQLFYFGNQKAKTPRGEFAAQHVIHHAWSETYKTFLTKNGISSAHIFLNGQPAYSLYDEPYRHYFPSRVELAKRYGLDASRRWILFPENYNWAFYSKATLDRFVQSGQAPEDVQYMREFCDSSLRVVLGWCAQAAKGDIELILRPRPSTTQREFEEFAIRELSEIPERLHIIQKESVREWILASDIVVSSHSTSLIEAAVAGKQVYILEPSPIPPSLHVDWHNLLHHLNSEQDFLDVCFGKSVKTDERLSQWARKTMMAYGDAIRNLTGYLGDIIRGNVNVPVSVSRDAATPNIKWIPPAWIWSVYRRLKQWLRYRSSGGIEPEFIKDSLPSQEIEEIISRWALILTEK